MVFDFQVWICIHIIRTIHTINTMYLQILSKFSFFSPPQKKEKTVPCFHGKNRRNCWPRRDKKRWINKVSVARRLCRWEEEQTASWKNIGKYHFFLGNCKWGDIYHIPPINGQKGKWGLLGVKKTLLVGVIGIIAFITDWMAVLRGFKLMKIH